jgi:hypothetical protein
MKLVDLLSPNSNIRSEVSKIESRLSLLESRGFGDDAKIYRENLANAIKNQDPTTFAALSSDVGMLFSQASKSSPSKGATFKTLTEEEEAAMLNGRPSPSVFQISSTGELKEVSPRTYASPEENAKQKEIEAQYTILNERRAQAESASDLLPQVNRMGNLLDQNIKTGRFESLVLPIKQFAADLGFQAPDVATQEEFRALSGNVALGYVQKTKGAISNAEMEFFTNRISPGIGLDEKTNRQLVMFLREAAKKEDKIADAILEGQEKGENPYQIQRRIRAIKNDNSILKAFGVSEDGQVAGETRPLFNLEEQKRILKEEEARLSE